MNMEKQPEFKLSTDSAALALRLTEVAVGDIVRYDDLSKAIGRDVRSSAAGALESARRVAQRDSRAVFASVRGEGLRRLTDAEIVDLSDSGRDRIRRQAKRTAKKLVCVDYDALPAEKKVKHNAALSMMGALASIATDTAQKRLEKQIAETGKQLPAAKSAIEALGGIA